MISKKIKQETKDRNFEKQVRNGNWTIFKNHINKGMDPDTMVNGIPLLASAISFLNHEMVRYLLEKGANPMLATVSSGCTPLHFAFYHQSTEIVKLLVEYGAKVTLNNKGKTPMDTMADMPPMLLFTNQGFYQEMLKMGFKMDSYELPHFEILDEEYKRYKAKLELVCYREYCPGSLFDPDYLPFDLLILIQRVLAEIELE